MSDETPQAATERPLRRISRDAATDKTLREQRREIVATLVLARATYEQIRHAINDQLGVECSHGTIANDMAVIRGRWRERAAESFDNHLGEQMSYYDALLRATVPRALAGDHVALGDVLAVLDRRSRLLGLDAPQRVDARVAVGVTALDQLGALGEDALDERAAGIAAVLAEAGVLDVVGRESSTTADVDDTTVDAVDAASADGEAVGVPAA